MEFIVFTSNAVPLTISTTPEQTMAELQQILTETTGNSIHNIKIILTNDDSLNFEKTVPKYVKKIHEHTKKVNITLKKRLQQDRVNNQNKNKAKIEEYNIMKASLLQITSQRDTLYQSQKSVN